jgi:hypothetical protein
VSLGGALDVGVGGTGGNVVTMRMLMIDW